MSEDKALVIAWPPLLFAGCAGAGIVAHFVQPVPLANGALLRWLGGVLVVCSGALTAWAVATMKAAGTNVRPDRPTLAIVRSGPYRLTRNPMYLSLCGLQTSIALLMNDWIAFALAPMLFASLHFGVVLREEAYLERKFGEEYRGFKRSVRRWI